jgi:hypothetical protein
VPLARCVSIAGRLAERHWIPDIASRSRIDNQNQSSLSGADVHQQQLELLLHFGLRMLAALGMQAV